MMKCSFRIVVEPLTLNVEQMNIEQQMLTVTGCWMVWVLRTSNFVLFFYIVHHISHIVHKNILRNSYFTIISTFRQSKHSRHGRGSSGPVPKPVPCRAVHSVAPHTCTCHHAKYILRQPILRRDRAGEALQPPWPPAFP